jgi:hypothetical protein
MKRTNRSLKLIFSHYKIPFFLGLFFCCNFGSAKAENHPQIEKIEQEAKVGRLPDGRAYRTDDEGNQLVDYLAEMELDGDSQRKKIMALEKDIEEKNRVIEKLQGGSPVDVTTLSEKDIIGGGSRKPGAAANIHSDEVQQNVQEERLQNIEKQYQSKLVEKDKQIAGLVDELNHLKGEFDKAKELLAQSDKQHRELNEKTASFQAKQPETKSKLIFYKKEEPKESYDRVNASLHEEEVSKLSMLKKKAYESSDSRDVNAVFEGEVSTTNSATLNLSRKRAVDSLRGMINSQANKVQSLITRRDLLFAKAMRGRKQISVSPSAAVTSEGESLSQVASRIKTAQSINDLSIIAKDLSQIKRKIDEDLIFVEKYTRE